MTNVETVLNRLTKWRVIFTGWQLGTRSKEDPEAAAVRDHREVTILLRAEVNALTKILHDKGIVTPSEFEKVLVDEAEHLDRAYEEKFPGWKSADHGMVGDSRIAETMKGWRP